MKRHCFCWRCYRSPN